MKRRESHDDDTEAMKIIKARHGSYSPPLPGGYVDETELLLLSQHHAELAERRRKAKRTALMTRKGS